MEEINVPYVKEYDSNGILINPIKGLYKNEYKNRKQRRDYLHKNRFANNKKTAQIVVIGRFKFKKLRQLVACANKEFKYINHLLPTK